MEETADKGIVSVWNQQAAFDSVFHSLSFECRRAQENKDVLTWYNKIETILVHCDAIFTKTEREDIEKDLKVIRDKVNKFHSLPNINIPTLPRKLSEIYVLIYNFERKIRRIVNAHNPFLKSVPEDDVEDF